MPKDTTFRAVMLGITAALSPMLCDLSSWREISVAPMTLSTLPSSCWTAANSPGSARPVEDPQLEFSDRVTNPSATCLFCARGRVSHQKSQISIAFEKIPTSARRQLQKPSTGSSLPVPSNTIGHSECS